MGNSAGSVAETRPTLRRWFAVGFFVAFVGMLLFLTQFVPFRDGVMRVALWRFYLIELPKEFRVQTLGPSYSATPFSILGQHLALSAVVGLVAMACGALVRRRAAKHDSKSATKDGDST